MLASETRLKTSHEFEDFHGLALSRQIPLEEIPEPRLGHLTGWKILCEDLKPGQRYRVNADNTTAQQSIRKLVRRKELLDEYIVTTRKDGKRVYIVRLPQDSDDRRRLVRELGYGRWSKQLKPGRAVSPKILVPHLIPPAVASEDVESKRSWGDYAGLYRALKPRFGVKISVPAQDARVTLRRLAERGEIGRDYSLIERADPSGHHHYGGRSYNVYIVKLPIDPSERNRALRVLRHGSTRLEGSDYAARVLAERPSHRFIQDLQERWLQDFIAIPGGDQKRFSEPSGTIRWRIRRLEESQRVEKGEYTVRRDPEDASRTYVYHVVQGSSGHRGEVKEERRDVWLEQIRLVPKGREQFFSSNSSTLRNRIRELEKAGKINQGEFTVRRVRSNPNISYIHRSSKGSV